MYEKVSHLKREENNRKLLNLVGIKSKKNWLKFSMKYHPDRLKNERKHVPKEIFHIVSGVQKFS